MRLYFVRHGKASHNAPNDAARPLLPKGEKDVQQMATILKKLGVAPQHIYASPRVRAQQTARIIADALDTTIEIREECNFDFDLDKAIALASNLKDDETAIFVGHNPSMTEVVGALTGAQVDFKPGAIACTFAYRPHARGGVLEWFIKPKIANAMLDEAW